MVDTKTTDISPVLEMGPTQPSAAESIDQTQTKPGIFFCNVQRSFRHYMVELRALCECELANVLTRFHTNILSTFGVLTFEKSH